MSTKENSIILESKATLSLPDLYTIYARIVSKMNFETLKLIANSFLANDKTAYEKCKNNEFGWYFLVDSPGEFEKSLDTLSPPAAYVYSVPRDEWLAEKWRCLPVELLNLARRVEKDEFLVVFGFRDTENNDRFYSAAAVIMRAKDLIKRK